MVIHQDTTIQLCALALQVLEGDHLSDSATRNFIDKTNLLPSSTIIDFGHSLEACAKVLNLEYRNLAGTSEASAVLGYMTIVQQQPTCRDHTTRRPVCLQRTPRPQTRSRRPCCRKWRWLLVPAAKTPLQMASDSLALPLRSPHRQTASTTTRSKTRRIGHTYLALARTVSHSTT